VSPPRNDSSERAPRSDRLRPYRAKRRSDRTPEPEANGGRKRSSEPIFVIQEHDASTRHFDFRLEVHGALASWAVPKGPSTDPRDKRLALRTEDHPLDYGDFEGVIPEDEYGGGTVIVWDRGPFRNVRAGKDDDEGRADLAESIDEGHVEVHLEGEKIRGGYALVRTNLGGGSDEQWLLVKMDDDDADARRNPVSTETKAVLPGLTIDEMREAMDEAKGDTS